MAINPNKPTDLASALRRNASGQTVQVSPLDKKPKDLKQLVDEAGLPQAPLTPAGAGALGANADQQKMMGTPAQKKAALEQPKDLSTTLRTAQARTQATGQEQGAMQTAAQAQALSGLSSRVQGLVSGELAKATTNNINTTALATAPSATSIPKVPTGQESQAKSLLSKIVANPNDRQSMVELNKLLGRNIDTVLSPEEVKSMYGSVTDTIAQGVAGNVDKDITVSDLLQRGNIGYTPEQLSDLLDLPQDQINNLSIAQLRDRIDQVGQQEFAAAGEAGQQMTSQLASQAERESAREAFRDQNAVGLTASKADYDKVEQAIQSAENVKFNGKDFSVEELLKDGGINKAITEYLNAPEGSQARLDLEKNEPGLAKFINDNKAVLDGAVKAVGSGTQEFKNIQASNSSYRNIAQKLNPSLTQGFKFAAGSSEFTTEKAGSSGSPLIDVLAGVPADRLDATAATLRQASERYPGMIEQFNSMPKDKIEKWDISNPAGAFQSKFLPTLEKVQALRSTGDASQIAQILSPGSGSWDQVQLKYKEDKAASQLGLGGPPDMAWDTNGDGQLDPPEMIRDNMLAKYGNSLSLNMDPSYYKEFKTIGNVGGNGEVYKDDISKKLMDMGVVGGARPDVNKIDYSKFNDEELSRLSGIAGKNNWPNNGKIYAEYTKRMEEKRKREAEERGKREDAKLMETLQKLPTTSSGVYVPGISDSDL